MARMLGVNEVMRAIERVSAESEKAARAIVAESAAVVERAAKGNFEGSHKRGEPHVGGDKPNVVTGTLRRSIRHDPVRRVGFAEYTTLIGPTAVYGRRVELGYSGGGGGRGQQTTRPFPYFEPAVRASAPRLNAIARAHWAAATRLR